MKKTLKDKRNIVIFISIIVIILVVLLVSFSLTREHKPEFTLDPIYNVYPEEVRELYTNMVSVSCMGDLKLNFEENKEIISVEEIETTDLLNYTFSYLEKNLMLTDEIDSNIIKDASKKLFAVDVDLVKKIDNFQYGDYSYSLTKNIITRKENKCISNESQYVSQLYGYSYNQETLSIDINIGYSKEGYLYDLADKQLGEYDGDIKTLGSLFESNSYYRYNYILDDKTYKLRSIEWLNQP